jgi:hypothetical protein
MALVWGGVGRELEFLGWRVARGARRTGMLGGGAREAVPGRQCPGGGAREGEPGRGCLVVGAVGWACV